MFQNGKKIKCRLLYLVRYNLTLSYIGVGHLVFQTIYFIKIDAAHIYMPGFQDVRIDK